MEAKKSSRKRKTASRKPAAKKSTRKRKTASRKPAAKRTGAKRRGPGTSSTGPKKTKKK